MSTPFAINAPLPPDRFVGRRKAIDHVSGRLAEYMRQSTCLTGGPLTGKTSLLRYLAQSAASADLPGIKGACRVFFDGFSVGVSMLPSGFWAGILRGLQANPQTTTPLRVLLEDKLAKAKDNKIDLYDLEDVFDEFSAAKMPVIIFINNFEVLLESSHFWPPNDFFHLVRSLGQREPRGVSFVIATYRKLLDLWDPNKGASPFYNIIGNYSVGLLEDDEIRVFLKRGFDDLGLPLDTEVEEVIIEGSEGHPYLVNYLAQLCAECLQAGKAIEGKMLEDAFQDPNGPVVNRTYSSIVPDLASDRVENLIFGTIDDVKRAYTLTLLLSQVLFYAGLAMVIAGFVAGLMSGEKLISLFFGSGGIASMLISSLIVSPLDRVQNAAGNLVQLQMAYLAYYKQLYLLGGNDSKVSREDALTYAREIDHLTLSLMGSVQDFVERDRTSHSAERSGPRTSRRKGSHAPRNEKEITPQAP